MHSNTDNVDSSYQTPAIYISMHNILIVLRDAHMRNRSERFDFAYWSYTITHIYSWQYELQHLQAGESVAENMTIDTIVWCVACGTQLANMVW